MKSKKCKWCKKEFMPQRPLQSVCSPLCAAEQAAEKSWQKRKSKMASDIKTHSECMKELQIEVNHIARLIDKDKPCISSGVIMVQGDFKKNPNGGHYLSSGTHKSITFNLHNIHAQSVHDNTHLSANLLEYRKGIIARYGVEYLDYMDSLPLEYPILKPTKDDLVEATKIARRLVREMIKEDKIYTGDDAIKKRAEINSQLGLYN